MKISLAEIDEAALTLAGVQEAASYGVPDPETGERLVLAVRCTSPEAESFETIVSRLRSVAWPRGSCPSRSCSGPGRCPGRHRGRSCGPSWWPVPRASRPGWRCGYGAWISQGEGGPG